MVCLMFIYVVNKLIDLCISELQIVILHAKHDWRKYPHTHTHTRSEKPKIENFDIYFLVCFIFHNLSIYPKT